MKRPLLLLASTAVIVVAAIVVPDLLDMYRLQESIRTSARSYDANGGAWPRLSDACVSCHGVNGSSLNQNYPSLARQQEAYLREQLQNFISGQRSNSIMNGMARSLKADEVNWLAAYFAHQPARNNDYFRADAKQLQAGLQIVGSGKCTACHGDDLMGRAQFPRLAGEGYDYLLKQLDGFAAGRRRDPNSIMNQLASSWSADDRKAIATYLASHAVPVGAARR